MRRKHIELIRKVKYAWECSMGLTMFFFENVHHFVYFWKAGLSFLFCNSFV